MKGVVEVYRGEEKILEESNMLMDNLGSQIAFWMTLPRGFSGIPSASAIYDTSNYTVRAASLGKDAAGYNYHAHGPLVSTAIAKDGIFRVFSYGGSNGKSYKTEDFASYYNDSSGVSAIVAREVERFEDPLEKQVITIGGNTVGEILGPNWVNAGGETFSALGVNTDQNPTQTATFLYPLEKSKKYRVILRISSYVSGNISVGLGSSYTPYTTPTNGITYWDLTYSAGLPSLVIRGSNNFRARISEILIQKLVTEKVTVLPEYSHPQQQRLESKSTRVLSVPKSNYDYGHNVNLAISGNAYKSAGCYCPSGFSRFQVIYELPNTYSASASINNNTGFNAYEPPAGEAKSIDSRGFIRVTAKTLQEANTDYRQSAWKNGLNISTEDGPLHDTFEVVHTLGITKPDFICLNFFGGIYTVGLWGYDIEKMLEKGMNPPFSQYNIEDIDYKLFARKTFNKDLTYYNGRTINFIDVLNLKLMWRFKFV